MTTLNVNPFSVVGLTPKQKIELLEIYYDNNALYNREEVANKLGTSTYGLESMKPLRTPIHRSVEFYASKVAVGEPKVLSDNPQVVSAVERFLAWSNFSANKKLDIRKLALTGNSFKRVTTSEDKVFYEFIDPKDVTDFTLDNRGFITEIRIDYPVDDERGNTLTYTEFWTLDGGGYMASWIHPLGVDADLSMLGAPDSISYLAEFGIDFIPIVHCKFKDVGDKYGVGCAEHSLTKIDEANRQATELHQTLYRYGKPKWAVSANQIDKDGRPMPAPKIKNPSTGIISNDTELKDNSILYLPGNSSIDSLTPNIEYANALAILQAQEEEIRQDMPELIYYNLPDRELSGRALRTLLGAAVDNAVECEDNYVQAMVRLNMMAITIGQFMGFFPNFGSFDNGDFEHEMQFESQFNETPEEKAAALKSLTDAGMPLQAAMSILQFPQEQIDLIPNTVSTTPTP